MNSVTSDKAPRVIVALDFPTAAEALALVGTLTPELCRLKVGFELFTSAGPAFVTTLVERGFDVFLDLKFHDIPATVARACRAAAHLGVWMLNVHALGGRSMLEAARKAIDENTRRPLLIGVTLLTSHAAQDLSDLGLGTNIEAQATRLAALVKHAGLDGVVCSAQEASLLRSIHGKHFCLVTPGIRLEGMPKADQQRVMTPTEALRAGADYLVIGRPITQAADPVAQLSKINRQLQNP